MAERALLDTGVLVALANRADPDHAVCVEALKRSSAGLVTVEGVLVEACFLLKRSRAPERPLELALALGAHVHAQSPGGLKRAADFMRRYRSRSIDLVDALLCVTAEELDIRRIFTLDRRDFSVYRLRGNRALELVP